MSYSRDEFLKTAQNNLFLSKAGSWPIDKLKERRVGISQVKKHSIGYLPYGKVEVEGNVLYGPCLVFPLLNEYGSCLGFVVRNDRGYHKIAFDKHSKYFKQFLYGLAPNLETVYRHDVILLTEGIFDFLAVDKYFPACAGMLTSRLSYDQTQYLKRYVKKILFLPDGDKTGRKSMQAAVDYLSRDFSIVTLKIPVKDPSQWLQNSPDDFKEYFEDLKYFNL